MPGKPGERFRFDPSCPFELIGAAADRSYVSLFDELDVDRSNLVEEVPAPSGPKHPEVSVAMEGEDGNAFAILGRVQKALRDGGVESEEVREFVDPGDGR